jgi:hypothetical protein
MAAAVTELHARVCGAVVIDAALGRALRAQPAPIRAGQLLGSSGCFGAGDALYITTRGRDGGQGVLGIGIAGLAAAGIEHAAPDAIVVDGLQLLWRSATGEN